MENYKKNLSEQPKNILETEQIKESALKSGDMILVEKLHKDFNISLTQEELLELSEKIYNSSSLYDLTKIIEKLANPDIKLIEKKNGLLEQAKKNFSLNKEKILTGLENKDMLLHFSNRKNLLPILQEGILSIGEQRKNGKEVEIGQGPDVQKYFGRFDAVSVHNIYKGANGEYDKELFEDMESKVINLIYEFQYKYPEKAFLIGSKSPESEEDVVYISNKKDKERLLGEFSKCIHISKECNYYINPEEKINYRYNSLVNVLVCRKDDSGCSIEIRNGYVDFTEFFKEHINDEKQKLLNEIKEIMQNAYSISVKNKNLSKTNIDSKRLITAFDESDYQGKVIGNTSVFILDPTLQKSFVLSAYFNESLIDEKITPDKILGVKLTDKYTEKECYNLGKVGFNVLVNSKEENINLDNKEIIFSDGGITVYTQNPYKS